MLYSVVTGDQLMPGHGRKQFATRPSHGIRRKLTDHLSQGFRIRQITSVLVDELAQSLTIAQSLKGSGHQGQMDIPPGLVPGPEGSRRNILLHTFRGSAQPGVFPIVDRSCPIRGQILNEAAFHQAGQQRHGAIPDQVSPIHENHGGPRFSSRPNRCHHLGHRVGLSRRQGSRRVIR